VVPALTVGPLHAFRHWYLRWQEGQAVLCSVYYPTPWPPDMPLRASCEQTLRTLASRGRQLCTRGTTRHAAPAVDCWCGIYALKELEGVEQWELLPPASQPDPDQGSM